MHVYIGSNFDLLFVLEFFFVNQEENTSQQMLPEFILAFKVPRWCFWGSRLCQVLIIGVIIFYDYSIRGKPF